MKTKFSHKIFTAEEREKITSLQNVPFNFLFPEDDLSYKFMSTDFLKIFPNINTLTILPPKNPKTLESTTKIWISLENRIYLSLDFLNSFPNLTDLRIDGSEIFLSTLSYEKIEILQIKKCKIIGILDLDNFSNLKRVRFESIVSPQHVYQTAIDQLSEKGVTVESIDPPLTRTQGAIIKAD